jgi:hypothetical protein
MIYTLHICVYTITKILALSPYRLLHYCYDGAVICCSEQSMIEWSYIKIKTVSKWYGLFLIVGLS